MQLSHKISIMLVALLVALNACLGDPVCPCQTQPPIPPNDCYSDRCKTVQTLPANLSEEVQNSPFYQTIITVTPGEKEVDSVCCTFCPSDNRSFIEFITIVYSDGSFRISKVFASIPQLGTIRLAGFSNKASDSSYVSNDYVNGVACENCTGTTYTVYKCVLFADCTLTRDPSRDYLYTLSQEPDVPSSCLDQAEALFDQCGLQKGILARPPHRLHRKCVTSYNGMPCINTGKVPAGDGIAYPLDQCA